MLSGRFRPSVLSHGCRSIQSWITPSKGADASACRERPSTAPWRRHSRRYLSVLSSTPRSFSRCARYLPPLPTSTSAHISSRSDSFIRWAYRTPRWLLPTTRAKHASWPNLRALAVVQTVLGPAGFGSTRTVNAFLRGLVRTEYARFGLGSIEPDEPFDVDQHMLIPGRSAMTRAFGDLVRHRGEVRRIDGHEITLDDGESFDTDLVLWATGYRMDLGYLGLSEYRDVATLDELLPRLGSLVRSRAHPNLFFVGMTLLNSTSATPFLAAVESKSIVAHILGRCEIPEAPVAHQITHWDLYRHFARFDRATYPRGSWRVVHGLRALRYAVFRNASVRV